MNVTELRLGNFLMYHGKVVEVYSIGDRGINYEDQGFNGESWWGPDCHIDKLTPIPITEEWLMKFGFGKSISGNWYSNDEYAIEMCIDFIQFDVGYTTITLDCKFVHQLQNLYFCLTGKELTIK